MTGQNVTVARGTTVEETLRTTCEHFLTEQASRDHVKDKSVFVNVHLADATGAPASVNPETVYHLARILQDWGAGSVTIGGIPDWGFSSRHVATFLDLPDTCAAAGAEFVFLDEPTIETREETVQDRTYNVPAPILDADLYISLCPGKNHPAWEGAYSCLNATRVLQDDAKRLPGVEEAKRKEYCLNDAYKDHFLRRVGDLLTIRAPDWCLVDCYYYLEGQGLTSFNSRVAEPRFMVLGNNPVATDAVVLSQCGYDPKQNAVLGTCNDRGLGERDPARIEVAVVDEVDLQFRPAPAVLVADARALKPAHLEVQGGAACTGCLVQVRRLLDFLHTTTTLELGDLGKTSLVYGNNPGDPDQQECVLVFGDCAIHTTPDRDFREIVKVKEKVIKPKDKTVLGKLAKKVKGEDHEPKGAEYYEERVEKKVKKKPNAGVLELPGCPPDALEALKKLVEFDEKALPATGFFTEVLQWTFQVSEKRAKKIREEVAEFERTRE